MSNKVIVEQIEKWQNQMFYSWKAYQYRERLIERLAMVSGVSVDEATKYLAWLAYFFDEETAYEQAENMLTYWYTYHYNELGLALLVDTIINAALVEEHAANYNQLFKQPKKVA